MTRWENLSFQRSLPSARESEGDEEQDARSFFRSGCYTVSTDKRKTTVGPEERKHHENSHFPRWHPHRVRSVGSRTRAHPGGWRTLCPIILVWAGTCQTPCATLDGL